MDSPYILEETDDYAVVFKPPKMHSEGLREELSQRHKGTKEFNNDTTIFNWYENYVENSKYVRLMHRLDYETQGLVLFAKNETSYLFFKAAQDNNEFIKEYSAKVIKNEETNVGIKEKDNLYKMFDGFPEKPSALSATSRLCVSKFSEPIKIESYFRPYGPGRKLVRPVIEDGKKHKEVAKDKGGFYQTEIINIEGDIFTVRIKRGFRHQIRCHLSWIGCPILNDPLYSTINEQSSPDSIMALRSHAIFFPNPENGNQLEYKINKLN